MLLGKSDEFDTRVRKQAETLGAAGYDVRVISLGVPGRPGSEAAGGVTYERVDVPEATRDAWRRRRRRQERTYERRVARYVRPATEPPEREEGAVRPRRRLPRGVIAPARLLYRTKLGLEREVYLWLRAVRWHSAYAAAVSEPLRRFAPDVVHAHDLLTLHAGRRHARLHGVPLVYDAHELELRSRRYFGRRDRLIASVVETRGARSARAVITVSPQIARWLARRYRIPAPLVLLNSPPLEASRRAAPFSLRDACGLDSGDVLVVFTGGVAPGRGLDRAVAALAILGAPYHLAIVGPGRGGRRDEFLRTCARAAGVDERLHLLDPVPGQMVSAVIGEADAAIIPLENLCLSYDLALPNKLFEAVMAGLPIASNGLRAISEFVRRHELGAVFDVRDAASIARAVRDVVEHPPRGVTDRGRLEALREDVCWERQAEKLLALYDRLAVPGGDALREATIPSTMHILGARIGLWRAR